MWRQSVASVYNPGSPISFCFRREIRLNNPELEVGMSNTKCRILYVDDHEDSSLMLQLVLADSDYEVQAAHGFEQALKMAASENFDLYVVDKRLPDGSGLQLVQELKLL